MMKQLWRYTPTFPIMIPTRAQERNVIRRPATFRFRREGRQNYLSRSAVHGVGEGAEGPVASM
jgi:hypothetical protein